MGHRETKSSSGRIKRRVSGNRALQGINIPNSEAPLYWHLPELTAIATWWVGALAFPCAQKSIQKSIWSRCRILHITLDEEMHLTGKEVEVWWWACDYRTYSSSHICNNPEAAGLMDIRLNPLIVGAAEAPAWTQHSKDGAPSFRMQYILQINSPYTVLSPPNVEQRYGRSWVLLTFTPMTHLDNLFYLPMPSWSACFQWAKVFIREHSESLIEL